MRTPRIAWSAAILLLVVPARASADFIPLGDLPGGFALSRAFGVSADGSVAVGFGNTTAFRNEAFRWTEATGMVGLGANAGVGAAASSDGAVVVGDGVFGGPTNTAYRWTQATGAVSLGFLPGGLESFGTGVSANGAVVVGSSRSAAAGPTSLEAFRWTEATGMVGLGDLPGGIFLSGAAAASADGTVVVGEGTGASGTEAFRWTEATGMIGLGDLPGGPFVSRAMAVSADGSVIVGHSATRLGIRNSAFLEAFIWDSATGMRNLRDVLIAQGDDLTGWVLQDARGISADGGTIVGSGIHPSGALLAWLARIGPAGAVPEPHGIALLAIGALALAACRCAFRQRQRKNSR